MRGELSTGRCWGLELTWKRKKAAFDELQRDITWEINMRRKGIDKDTGTSQVRTEKQRLPAEIRVTLPDKTLVGTPFERAQAALYAEADQAAAHVRRHFRGDNAPSTSATPSATPRDDPVDVETISGELARTLIHLPAGWEELAVEGERAKAQERFRTMIELEGKRAEAVGEATRRH